MGADRVVLVSITLTVAAWGLMAAFGHSLLWIGVGIVILDVGAAAAHIAKQTTLFALAPGIRTRMVTIYVVAQYLGGGLLALLTGFAWALGGWPGVCMLGFGTTTLALAVNVADEFSRSAYRNR